MMNRTGADQHRPQCFGAKHEGKDGLGGAQGGPFTRLQSSQSDETRSRECKCEPGEHWNSR